MKTLAIYEKHHNWILYKLYFEQWHSTQ